MTESMSSVSLTNSTTENLSRHELLDWINSVVHGQHKKIEELCSGVAYCQMMNLLFPQSVSLKKIKTNAKLEHEYLHNLKLFQASFARINYEKSVPIDRLIKGRFQDNFEFLQWFKKFFDQNAEGKENLKVPAALAAAAANAPRPVRRPLGMSNSSSSAEQADVSKSSAATPVSKSSTKVSAASSEKMATKKPQGLDNRHHMIIEEKEEMVQKVATAKYERDYYYKKLTVVEELLAEYDSTNSKKCSDFCKRAFEILYAMDGNTTSETTEADEPATADGGIKQMP